MKKVLLIGHADGLGGAQTAFKELVKILEEDSFSLRYILIIDKNKYNDNTYNEKYVLSKIPLKTKGLNIAIKLLKLSISILRARLYKPQVLITVGLNNTAISVASFMHKECYKIAQDFIADREVNDKIWRKCLKVFNGIAMQSPKMIEIIKNKGEQELKKINWLYCLPEPPVEKLQNFPKKQIKDKVRICYFGRIASNKGLDILIEALNNEKLKDKISLDIWGRGDEERKLKLQINKNLQDNNIQLKGKYPDKFEFAKLIQKYDALVLCSTRTEGLPLILLEAMAYGLPFLVTNVGAISDCTLENKDSILVEPDIVSIINGIEELYLKLEAGYFNRERQKKYYYKYYSREVMKKRWIQCIENPKEFFNL